MGSSLVPSTFSTFHFLSSSTASGGVPSSAISASIYLSEALKTQQKQQQAFQVSLQLLRR